MSTSDGKIDNRPAATRSEHDLLGVVEVPEHAHYGGQTQRALDNFPLRGERSLGDFPQLTAALITVKHAAAAANKSIGDLPTDKADAIIAAAQTLVAADHRVHFPIHALHGGGGTSANMNANEVLANLAERSLGGQFGRYELVHPNDHVNLNQSTNDVYPTACHMAIIACWRRVGPTLSALADAFCAKADEYRDQTRLARTCLQDAVAICCRDFFGGYVSMLRRNVERVGRAVDALHAVNLGGTVVGSRDLVPPAYAEAIVATLCDVAGDAAFRPADDLFDAAQNPDDMAAVSAALDLLARGLIKVCSDLRLLNSGPEGGIGELQLPAVQPGSSMMPGKVNPVMPEFAMQLCFSVVGRHAACVMAVDHGELDLNVWESVFCVNIAEAMALLESAASALAGKCIDGLVVPGPVNDRHAAGLIPLLTALMLEHGYSTISDMCKSAGGDPAKIRAKLTAEGML